MTGDSFAPYDEILRWFQIIPLVLSWIFFGYEVIEFRSSRFEKG